MKNKYKPADTYGDTDKFILKFVIYNTSDSWYEDFKSCVKGGISSIYNASYPDSTGCNLIIRVDPKLGQDT